MSQNNDKGLGYSATIRIRGVSHSKSPVAVDFQFAHINVAGQIVGPLMLLKGSLDGFPG